MEKVLIMIALSLDKYSIIGNSGLGCQTKFWVGDRLIKLDSLYREAEKEVSASVFASILGLYHADYVKLNVTLKGVNHVACASKSYLDRGKEREVTLYQILTLGNVNIKKNESALNIFNTSVLLIHRLTGIGITNIERWLLQILVFDYLICNEDRHLNNICIIKNKDGMYRLGPIYDNGNSFLGTNGDLTLSELNDRLKRFKSKPFSTNPKSNLINTQAARELAYQWEEMINVQYGSIFNIPINTGHRTIINHRLRQLKNLK